MKTPQATYFGWCGAIVVGAIVFVIPAFMTVPLLWYYPVRRAWALELRPNGLALDWYGRTIWAVMAAGASFPVAFVVARRVSTPASRAYLLWAAWAGMTSLLAMTVYSYQLAQRHPVPEPLPADYQAH